MVWVCAVLLIFFTISTTRSNTDLLHKALFDKISVDRSSDDASHDATDDENFKLFAINSLKASSLSEIPYVVEFSNFSISRDAMIAEKWLLEAFVATGRNRALYNPSVNIAINKGAFDEAIIKLDTLSRLNKNNSESVVEILAILYRTPKGNEKIRSYMSKGAPWGHRLLKKLIEEAAIQDVPDLISLIELFSAGQTSEYRNQLYAALYTRQIVLGDVNNAYTHWISNLNQQTQDDLIRGYVYDPGFHDEQLGPFMWRYYPSENVTIEKADLGQLFISFNGKQKSPILRQIVSLNGLNYVDFRVTHQLVFGSRKSLENLKWTITCIESRQAMKFTDNSLVSESKIEVKMRFTVPKIGCKFVELKLWAEPKSSFTRISLIVENPQILKYR